MPERTTEELKKIKIDAVYGKKKHFNAADRKLSYYNKLGVAVISINIFTGSVLCYILFNLGWDSLRYIVLILIFLGALIGGLQTFFNFSKQSEGHRNLGNRYLSIFKKCNRIEAYIADRYVDPGKTVELIEEISKEIDSVNKDAIAFPTTDTDYKKAQNGIIEGEEEYTNKEFDI